MQPVEAAIGGSGSIAATRIAALRTQLHDAHQSAAKLCFPLGGQGFNSARTIPLREAPGNL